MAILVHIFVFPHLHIVGFSINRKVWHLLLAKIFVENWIPNLLGPRENIFEGVLIHLFLNLDHVRPFLGVISFEVRSVLLAAREYSHKDELVQTLRLLLGEVESLQDLNTVVQHVRVGLPCHVVLQCCQYLI